MRKYESTVDLAMTLIKSPHCSVAAPDLMLDVVGSSKYLLMLGFIVYSAPGCTF